MPNKLRNIAKILTSADNGNEIVLYSPGLVEGYQCDALIWDFFACFSISSIAELPYIPLPVGGALMTPEESDADFEERTKNSPAKILDIGIERDGITVPGAQILFYRRSPSYKEELVRFLTKETKLGIEFGTKIKCSIKDWNSGLLGPGDSISIWMVAEEIRFLDYNQLISLV